MLGIFSRSLNKKRKKIYRFKYEDTTWHNEFYGYLNPSQDYSIISLKRFEEHGFNINKYRFDKITSSNHLSRNKLDNIAGVCVLSISFEKSANGLNNIRINGSTNTPSNSNNNKIEKKIHNVLVLKESPVEFRLGNDFLEDNAIIEPKPRSNYDKRKCTHQLKFIKDGVTVDLEKVENVHDIYGDEEDNVSSDGDDDENDDYVDGGKIAQNSNSKHRLNKYKFFKNLLKPNNRVEFWNIVIIISLLFIISAILYSSYKETQSLVEELVIPPFNNQFTKPSIDEKIEDYVRKLKATTSFLELFELDNRQNTKALKSSSSSASTSKSSSKQSSKSSSESSSKSSKSLKSSKSSLKSSSKSSKSSITSSSSSASTTMSSSSQQKVERDRVEVEEDLYTNLVKYAESLDNTKRTLLDMYNQEVAYSFIFQQDVENLSKYLTLKKRRNILRMIPIVGRDVYFPLTKNFKGLVDNVDHVINNTLIVMDEMTSVQIYCERIMNQVGKLKNELEPFNESSTAWSWLKTFLPKFTKVVDQLGKIDSEIGLKCKKLLIGLDKDLRELLSLFKGLRWKLMDHLSVLFKFSEHFKITDRVTDLEINIIKKHLVELQNNRKIIFDEVKILKEEEKDDDICPAPSPIFSYRPIVN